MRSRSLNRILREALIAAVPSLALAGCGDEPGTYENQCWEIEGQSVQPPHADYFEITPDDAAAIGLDGDLATCRDLCVPPEKRGTVRSRDVISCRETTSFHGKPIVECTLPASKPCGLITPGRAPEGLDRSPPSRAGVGAWLAEAARLEAASVPAFRRLARELRAHGAPASLARAADRFAEDEIRHAHLMARFAARFGAASEWPAVGDLPVRELAAVAAENAREGCVRETFAAAVAGLQGRTARRAGLRAAFHRIAEDEVRHAALAWRVDAWLAARLGRSFRDVRREEAARLRVEVASSDADRELGLPSADEALQLVDALGASLWEARA